MAVDAFLVLVDQNDKLTIGESTVNPDFTDPMPGRPSITGVPASVLELLDYSFGIENKTAVGSAAAGAGSGKVAFNEFAVTRRADTVSPVLHKTCCSGAHFTHVDLLVRRAGATGAGSLVAAFGFSTVFITKIDWSSGESGVDEVITFAYGTLRVGYPKADRSWDIKGWDIVKGAETTT